MRTNQTEPTLTPLQAARLTCEIFGPEQTEHALATVFGMTPDQICTIMRQLKASEN